MKKKLLLTVVAVSLVLSLGSCELLFLAMFENAGNSPGAGGEGSVDSPIVLTLSPNAMMTARSSTVGYGTNHNSSYYRFVAPSSSPICTITIDRLSPSLSDLDYYLYSNSNFTNSITMWMTNSGDWTPSGLVAGQTYYLKVRNYESDKVYFYLRIHGNFDTANAIQISPISSTNYPDRSNWSYKYRYSSSSIDWYCVNTNSLTTYYIHWQDYYDYDNTYSQPTADVIVSVYTPSGLLIKGPRNNGYSSNYYGSSTYDGLSVSGYTQYYIKVEDDYPYSHYPLGSYYLSVTY